MMIRKAGTPQRDLLRAGSSAPYNMSERFTTETGYE